MSAGYGYNFQELIYNRIAVAVVSLASMRYISVLNAVRNRITANFSEEMIQAIGDPTKKPKMKSLIMGCLQDLHIFADDGSTHAELVDRLYEDMFEFSFLGKHLMDDEVEEINIFAWNNIQIVKRGAAFRLYETFISPEHAYDVVMRMVRLTGKQVLDNAKPECDSFIGTGIRIHAKIPPIIDARIGVYASIRKQRSRKFSMDELIELKMCEREMLEFMVFAAAYGASVGIVGGTGSGKTTLLQVIGRRLAMMQKRIYVVEDTRELDFEIFDEDGNPASYVIHTKTRYSDIAGQNIDLAVLTRSSLRCNPDVNIISEMRGAEALFVQEMARTGHEVIVTYHAEGCDDAYDRFCTMCEMGNKNLSEKSLRNFTHEALPITVHVAQLADGSRRIMAISEAVKTANGEWATNLLWQYAITENVVENGRTVKVRGRFIRRSNISASLAYKLLVRGAPLDEIRRFAGEDFDPLKLAA